MQLMHERDGVETRDYSKHRGSALLLEGIFAPEGAPDWAHDREQLWNRAEAAERQKVNGQPARNMIVAFPHELDQQQREWLLKDFAREQFARKGMVADVAMHAPDKGGDGRNYHAHILLTMRRIEGGEFARLKAREWNRTEQLEEWRGAWAEKGAKALERAGHPIEAERWRHGHETLEKQRAAALALGDTEFAESLEREATTHKGAKLSAMERRGVDVESDWLDGAKQIEARNDARAEAKAADRELAGLQAEQAREDAAKAAAGREAEARAQVAAAKAEALAKVRAFAQERERLNQLAAMQKLEQADHADRKTFKDPTAEAFWRGARDQAQDIRTEREEEKFQQRQEEWKKRRDAHQPQDATRAVKSAAHDAKAGGLNVVNKTTGLVSGLGDFMTGFLANLGGSSAPEQPREAQPAGKSVAAFLMDPAERKRQQLARVTERDADDRDHKALLRMGEDVKAGKALSSSDISNLTRAHQDQIAHFGDDAVRRMVEDARRREEERARGGRERERD